MSYDSGWEIEYSDRLELLRKAGEIKSWRRVDSHSTEFPMRVNGVMICHHNPDFIVTTNTGTIVAHEIKGWNKGLQVWTIKRKMFEACYPEIKYLTFTKYRGAWVPYKRTFPKRSKSWANKD